MFGIRLLWGLVCRGIVGVRCEVGVLFRGTGRGWWIGGNLLRAGTIRCGVVSVGGLLWELMYVGTLRLTYSSFLPILVEGICIGWGG